MGVNGVDPSQSASIAAQSNSSTKKSSGDNLSMNDFFTLLSAQLQYQDPMQPTDNSQFMAQMAQFSLLEQVQNLNQSINTLMASDTMGKSAVYNKTDGDGNVTQAAGKISAVDLSGDTPQYLMNGYWIPQSAIVQFFDPSQFPASGSPDDTTGGSANSDTGADTGTGA